MPMLVKLISQGVGIATEAYASSKKSKAAKAAAASSASASSSSAAAPESPSSPYRPGDDEQPQYAELPADEATDLIARGRAVAVDETGAAQEPAMTPAILEDDDVWALDEASEERRQHQHHSSDDLPLVVGSERPDISNNALIRDLVNRLPPAPSSPPQQPCLPYPVILPQRRPREKTRGFVRAYAPALEQAAGIDQASFLQFLKAFHTASQASPVFNVVLLASAVVGLVPSVAVMATTTAINAVVIPAQVAQQRHRANSFLDEANERLFKPRGLYAVIVAFKGEEDDGGVTGKPVEARQLDINAVFEKYGTGESSGSKWKDGARKLRLSSGKTYGEEGLPVAADLVFPGLEEEEDGEGQQAKGMKGKKKWLDDYNDRRAQAKFLAENPDSSLIKQKPEFASSWADPNHPAYQGSLVTLVSGGKISTPQRGGRGISGALSGAASSRGSRESQNQDHTSRGGFLGGRGGFLSGRGGGGLGMGRGGGGLGMGRGGGLGRGRGGFLGGRGLLGRQSSRGHQEYDDGRSPPSGYDATYSYAGEGDLRGGETAPRRGQQQQQLSGGRPGLAGRTGRPNIIGTVRKALQQDVLYLMIVNMPTDEEMAQAQAQLAELEAQTMSGCSELPV
ncbi:hypothetical protein DIS24_g2408 [Lasiodiplodia hormozganensis]|uniref:Uncharacterized protein n=1 Tax=Lasiodiplodia hormozganensis TaxID=869390 RepID=A0AA40D4X6_9PEZI|nr:hypothetical protein DIS24_g2408 [Lasiodiplodia hormozganensis]